MDSILPNCFTGLMKALITSASTLLLAGSFSLFTSLVTFTFEAHAAGDVKSCCVYNDDLQMPCWRNYQRWPKTFSIRWQDGVSMKYVLVEDTDSHRKIFKDRFGGIWHWYLTLNGNTGLENKENGNHIFFPLRGYDCWKDPFPSCVIGEDARLYLFAFLVDVSSPLVVQLKCHRHRHRQC